MTVFPLRCRSRLPAAVLMLAALAVGAFSASAFARIGQGYSIVKVGKAARFARTMPLRDMRYPGLPPLLRRVIGDSKLSEEQISQLREKLVKSGLLPPPGAVVVQPLGRMKPAINPPLRVRDPALQTTMPEISATPNSFTTPGLGFDGLGVSTGFTPTGAPPDTNAAVGENYIVETVNLAFAVYNKSYGSRVMGPVDIKNLWEAVGGSCANLHSSDPIVNYDQISQRWLISYVTLVNSNPPVPNYHCVAISQTSDPTGAYYVYAFPIVESGLPDYPKVAVWPGSYLASFHYFPSSGQPDGVFFAAYDSAQMQNGDPKAQMVEFHETDNVSPDLPVEVDGSDMPPAGTPGLFINYTSPNLDGAGTPYALDIWALRVDWSDPSAATLSKAGELTVDPFTDFVCGGAHNCIPQQTSSAKLDAISDRLMYRAVYRNFGDHQAIAAMHSVGTTASGNPPVGERWYELRAPASSTSPSAWSVYQQGTFAPADGNSRWMGSIAFDHVGNMAMGYSLSGPTQDPEIAYTGRLSTDPLGEMTQPETVLQPPGGASDGNRWGDYSSMQIDPGDDCTFWYANEYYASTGSPKNWSTHIGSMKFANCVVGPAGTLAGAVTDASSGAPIAGADVAINPGNIVIQTGSNGTYKDLLPVGNYTVTVTDFGYAAGGPASVTITQDQTTTQDFALAAASTAVLSGKVTDGSGHGYPLYAEIKISTPGFGEVSDVFTSSRSGHYSISLPVGYDYTLNVQAIAFDGYDPATATLTLSGDTTKNFSLTVNAVCTAPGYDFHFAGSLHEDFDGASFPPPGWTVTNDYPDSPVYWLPNTDWGLDNYTTKAEPPASDLAATAKNTSRSNPYDTSLITPPIPVTSLSGTGLQYDASYTAKTKTAALDLDISTDGGSTWTTITHWTTRHGALFGWPGEHVTLDLSGYLPSSGTFKLRWRYYDLTGGYSARAQIDNAFIGVGCTPITGGLAEGQVTDGNTGQGVIGAEVTDDQGEVTHTRDNPADPNLPAGSYEFFLPSGNRTLTASSYDYSPATAQLTMSNSAVVTQNLVLKAGKLAANPAGLTLHVMVNNAATASVALSNSGDGDVAYKILQVNAPPPGSTVAKGPFAMASSYNAHANLAAPTPNAAVTYHGTLQVPHVSASASATAGTPISIFGAGIPIYGLAVNHYASDLWLGSPSYNFQGGDAKDHRFLFDGTNTGDAIDVADRNILYMADAAYDDETGMIWQLSVDAPVDGTSSHIIEIDPRTMTRTGKSIRVPSPQSERGLAYDPLSNTWYAGDFNSGTIYHFDASGTLLDSADVELPIIGLAYNPATGHLFALTTTSSKFDANYAVYVLDPADAYAVVSRFYIRAFDRADAGAGFGYDCDNDLWVSNAGTRTVWRVASGETGWCAERNIPWLTVAPASGTLTTGAATNVVLSLDGTGQKAFTTSRAYLSVTNDTRYGTMSVPLTVTWDPQPIHLVLTGTASPSPVRKGGNLAYDLTVENQQMSNHGAATETTMSYQLPSGVTYIASSGDAACTDSSGTLSCDFGTIALGTSKSETVVVNVADAGTLTSTFQVSAREPDSDPSTNMVSIKTGVNGGGGGGGALGWLALAGLLGLALAGAWVRRRSG